MRDVYGAQYGASELAEPLITPDEAAQAPVSVCRIHHGRIANGLGFGDRYGKVYWCPVGSMYWRLTERLSGFLAPLQFPRNL